MMNYQQYLLIKLAEECTELAQRALKASQFGLDEIQAGQELTNFQRMKSEFNDVLAHADMINEEAVQFMLTRDEKQVAAKREKVAKFYALSKRCGQVE